MKYLALVAFFLVGCSSSPVPSLKQYLLRTDTPVQFSREDSAVMVGVGTVTVAPYIDGLGLVLETDDGEIHVARDHQWAEPLRMSLRSFLSGRISKDLGQPIRAYNYGDINLSRRIDVRIDELHGTKNGGVKLVAYWIIVDPDKQVVLSEGSFFDTEVLSRDGYNALVEAQKKLLDKLASSIAGTL